jgi:zinc transporter, ZIP family
MSFAETALLGAIAGITIYLGLPVGRLRRIDERLRVGLAMFSAGILAFIFMDVTTHAQSIVQTTLGQYKDGRTGFAHVLGLFALLALGFVAGTAGIAAAERRLMRSRRTAGPPIVGAAIGGTLTADEPARLQIEAALARANALRTGMTIAVAIGLHNFAEGLAIGNSAASGDLQLAVLLIVGFGLHNATEGFGIVAPMAASGERPSWRYLGLLGLIGGGPTFLGTVVGEQVTNSALAVAFLALAAGSILYVVMELLAVARKVGMKELTSYGILLGLILGFATDAIVTLAGA